jgi:hypothetical protein
MTNQGEARPMTTNPRPPRFARLRRAFRVLRDAWAIVGIVLALVLGLEGALRLVFGAKDAALNTDAPDPRLVQQGYDGADWVKTYFDEYRALKTQWSPYVYVREAPFEGETIHVDREGLRRTWNAPAPSGGGSRPTVLVLGGSAAWGEGARDDYTIPSLLAKELDRRGIAAEVVSLAQIGHTNTQELITLILRLREGRRPDLVLFYDGVNEALSAYQNGRAGWTYNEHHRALEFYLRNRHGEQLVRSARFLLKDTAIVRLALAIRSRLTTGKPFLAPFPPPQPTELTREELAEQVVDLYEANMRLIEAIGREYGFRSRFYWQPILFTKRHQTDYEQFQRGLWGPLAPLFLEVYRVARDRAAAPGDDFLDLSGLLDDSPELLFVDFCHKTEKANAIVAKAMADDVAGVLREDSVIFTLQLGGDPPRTQKGTEKGKEP